MELMFMLAAYIHLLELSVSREMLHKRSTVKYWEKRQELIDSWSFPVKTDDIGTNSLIDEKISRRSKHHIPKLKMVYFWSFAILEYFSILKYFHIGIEFDNIISELPMYLYSELHTSIRQYMPINPDIYPLKRVKLR